ncbi:uncharacterized protein M421DRAFT_223109 [Didymella exigua CBS 183.55]|uniref:Mid2 domain-containing protein n=1 Tax=Didymella exigua CBS 183.55 TaxID=1150837 RepID=A0A6A5REC5_9PLEO|nr:uncharacterized protein M421DRAFT_223109 [Didymella exigua CBS 183.55]KAF1926022.1 hypothetical protein M421DRAFT_223109 [Didymella exigua CBS 183.55]
MSSANNTAATLPASSAPAASSAAPSSAVPAASSAAPAVTSSTPPVATSVVTASSATPTTEIATSVVTVTPSATRAGETPTPIIITSIVTREGTSATVSTGSLASTTSGGSASSSTNTAGAVTSQGDQQKGLSTGGKTAIAVVVPVVVVALLVLAGILLWRKRKTRQNNEEERRKEVEEYGFNPNNDPTLPAVGVGGSEMAEDSSGYRGWGNTATSSNRKASTTLTSGMTYSDSNSNPGGYNTPHSPTGGAHSEGSHDPLMNGRRETIDSDGLGALGVVGGAVPNSTQNQAGVQRGPSNASSSYSAANRSDASGDYPGYTNGNANEYYDNQGYYQTSPYGNNDPYGAGQQPVIRDVSARRNTRIENPSVFPQQGNSGIAQNF